MASEEASEEASEDVLPEWILEDDPCAYEHMEPFIKDNQIQKLDAYLKGKSKCHRLSPRSFSHVLNKDPHKHKKSLLMLSLAIKASKSAKYILSNYGDLIDVNSKEWVFYGGVWSMSAPLHIASASGMIEVVKMLVEAGANVDICNCCDETPLHTGSRRGNKEILEFLLNHGANINAQNRFGDTPLITSIIPCNLEITKFFLRRGADCSQASNQGYTPMHVAARRNDIQVVKELLLFGVPPSLFVNEDYSSVSFVPCPLYLSACCHSCISFESERIVQLLMSLPNCPATSKVDALLLLGSYSEQPICREIHWREAISIRESLGILPSPSVCIEEYGSRVEMSSFEDLEKVMGSDLEEAYQCLLIQERCLGYADDQVARTLREIASADLKHFETLWFRYLDMLLHRWDMMVQVKSIGILFSVVLSDCTQHVGRMLFCNQQPCFHRYIEFGMKGMELLNKSIDYCICGKGVTVGDLCGVTWHILGIFSQWLASDLKQGDKPSKCLEMVGCRFISECLHLKDSTILHTFLAQLCFRLPENELGLKDLFGLVPSLLCWGADSVINTPIHGGYRPIHLAILLVNKMCWPCNGQVPIIPALLEHGAHLDAVSLCGNQTALEMCTNSDAKVLLDCCVPPLLTCQAARVIISEHIPYQELDCLPEKVKTFIALHDPNP